MNVRDSEIIAGLLRQEGFALADSWEEAQVVIFNTCSVRQHAEDKVWSEIGRIAKKGKRLIGLVGCMAQNYEQKVFTRSPHVDFVVGPKNIQSIGKVVKAAFEKRVRETGAKARDESMYHTGFHASKDHCFTVISHGCSNYCSYCVVPFVRGELQHRKHEDILREVKEAVDSGIPSITLLGQNVNSYKDGKVGFVELIGMVEKVAGLKEFGFVTSHPKDASPELFKVMGASKKLKKYLHLPFQSGADSVLKRMNRGYTRAHYLALVEQYRALVPGGQLSTDVIVGFPGETEEEFAQTRSLLEQVRFDCAFLFKYSPRPHTAASKLPDDVTQKDKERRHRILLDLQKRISKELR
jgi:tRNA-2-methylthio-N6-dimethylallyladenosine synthase